MFVRHHLWLGIAPIFAVVFLLFSFVVIVAAAGACVLIWRAAARRHPGSPPPGNGQPRGYGPPPGPPSAQAQPDTDPGAGTQGPMTPAKTVEERLADLDDLHSRGVISDEEHRAARAKVIAEG